MQTAPIQTGIQSDPATFLRLVNHPVKFRLFLLRKLPSAFFSGVRVVYADEKTCKVKVPYKWFSQNPFRSTYFACLSMAAEMSTGVLAMAHLYKSNPVVSMLVTKVEGDFIKKATANTYFVCDAGEKIKHTIAECIKTNTPQAVRIETTGSNNDGEMIARFFVTWSFKAK
ncbi:MAG TPA: DUF4442 domain-containing protein [Chitinophagaceae bacterium]|jgi:hypothetical protein